jgi:hypothetical protein
VAESRALGSQQQTLLFWGAVLFTYALLDVVADFHGVNADEGFYLSAGRDVAQGLRPYADFFYPQMPYLAYVESFFFARSGLGLEAGRGLSTVPAAFLGGLLALTCGRRTGRYGIGAVAVLAFATHALSLNYFTVLKTYGLSNLLIVPAALLISSECADARRAAAAGALTALAVGVRLPLVAVGAVLLLWSLRNDARQAGAFAGAAMVAALPLVIIASHDMDAFWFDNFGFHELRREIVGFGPIIGQKIDVLPKWLLLPQNLVIWCLAIVGCRRGARREWCAFSCAAALGVVYLYATPTYLEYMVQLIPFLLIAAIPAIALLLERRTTAVAVAVLWLVGLAVALRPPSPESARAQKMLLWDLETVESVAQYLHDHSAPTDKILSWWEGYPVLAERPGFREVGFWHSNAAKKLSAEERRRYHVAGAEDVRTIIEAGEPRLIVAAEGEWTDLRRSIDAKYRPARTFGAIQVFERHG